MSNFCLMIKEGLREVAYNLSKVLVILILTLLTTDVLAEGRVYGPLPRPQEPIQVGAEWAKIQRAVLQGDLESVHKGVGELQDLAVIEGTRTYDTFALYLLERAKEAYQEGETEQAAFYLRKAGDLSATSFPVRFVGLGLSHRLGHTSLWEELVFLSRAFFRNHKTILQILSSGAYPVLCATMISLLFAFLIFYLVSLVPFLRTLAGKLPFRVRGFFAPLLALFLFLAPLPFGPVWTLVVWSVVAWFTLEKSRILIFGAGVVLALIGFLIPLRENVKVWLRDPGVVAMLRVIRSDYQPQAERILLDLVSRRQTDPVAHYSLGVAYRRLGKYDEALASFAQVDAIYGANDYTRAQRGMIAFLRNNAEKAAKIFSEIESSSGESAAFLFNYSKVAFELLDTEKSRELAARASRLDPELVRLLSLQEDRMGLNAAGALAEMRLPLSLILRSALIPLPIALKRTQDVAQKIMPGIPAAGIGLLGMILVFLALIPQRITKTRFTVGYYKSYRTPSVLRGLLKILPGGAWMLARRYALATCILTLFFLLLLPFFGWPHDVARLLISAPWLKTSVLYFLLIFLLIFYYLGFFIDERVEE